MNRNNVKLKDVSTIIRGISFPKDAKSKKYAEGLLACLRTTNVQKEVEWGDLWFVPKKHLKRDEQLIRKYDILISTANSYELVGKVAQVKDIPYESTLGAFISAIRINEECDPKYFYYQLASSTVQNDMRSLSSTTTNISNISTKKLQTIGLTLLSLNEQKRIVAKIEQLFSDLDAGVETLCALKKQIRQYRQSVLKSAFEGKLTTEWRKANKDKIEPASALLEKIAKEKAQKTKGKKQKKLPPLTKDEIDNLPESSDGWAWIRLGDAIEEPKYGTSKKCSYENQGLGVLRIPNIANGIVDSEDLKYAEFDNKERETYRLLKGDLLTIRSNGSVSLVGKCAMIAEVDEQFLFAGYLIRIRSVDNLIVSKYLLYAMNSCFLRTQIESKAKSTSGVNNINSNEIKSLAIPLCTFAEQKQIISEIERHFSIANKVEEVVDTAFKQSGRLRQSILKRAFEGKLVPQDPNDEPAEKLLGRIKS